MKLVKSRLKAAIKLKNMVIGRSISQVLKNLILPFFFLLLLQTYIPSGAKADAINYSGAETAPNIAEFHIREDGVLVKLEIYPRDLEPFKLLLPDNMLRSVPTERPSQLERLKIFSNERIIINDDNGDVLNAKLMLLEPRQRIERYAPNAGKLNPITKQIIPKAPQDKRVMYVEMFYAFGNTQPGSLTITPPLDKNGLPIMNIGFIAHHRQVKINDFRYMARSEIVTLNWQDAWYSAFENPSIKRHYKDGMLSFLYIEPREIRHELLLRIRELEKWIDFDLKGKKQISKEDQILLKDWILKSVAAKNPLEIDGVPHQPVEASAQYVEIKPEGITNIERDGSIDSEIAMIGVVLKYRVASMPQEVTVDWGLFNSNQTRIPTNLNDIAGPFNSFVEPDDSIIKWQNFLKTYKEPEILPIDLGEERRMHLPLLTITLLIATIGTGLVFFKRRLMSSSRRIGVLAVMVLASGFSVLTGWVSINSPYPGLPSEKSAKRIVTQAIENIHNALKEKELQRIDNALGVTVSAESLNEVKLEAQRALMINIKGGGSASIEKINDFEIGNIQSIQGTNGFQASVNWSVLASGNHWGHPHKKNIRFSAIIDLVPRSDDWKLTGITVTSAQPG